MKCIICETENPRWSWTDTHGIAQCHVCGIPHRLYFYDTNYNRIEREPECIVLPGYVEKIKEYWRTFHRIIPSDCSFPGGQELASSEDHEHFHIWFKLNTQDEV